MPNSYKIQLGGQVQGVGFRPFVYNLAQRLGLNGTVCNDENGVLIHANGTKDELVQFLGDILEKAPDAAIIQSHTMEPTERRQFDGFHILPPQKTGRLSVPLTADFAICSACKNEVLDPNNRRFGYAFTTCTQCGPRYAITKTFPFERENTGMDAFTMCSDCNEEYVNAADRRFHSQTNSCATCGITLTLEDFEGKPVVQSNGNTKIQQITECLKAGAIVALKNTNGFLLVVDATNDAAVERLRVRKQRPDKPFALLYKDLEAVAADFEVSGEETDMLSSPMAPIVLLSPKEHVKTSLSEKVAPNLNRYGVMLPSSALLLLLSSTMRIPLVATSGNLHGSPILSNEKEARQKLAPVADYMVHHDLQIVFPQDDSVCHFIDGQRILLRRSRGLAPNFMDYRPKTKERVLAMGAHLKSTLAFTPNGHTYVSPYFGNLDSYEVLQRYTETLQLYTQLFEVLPEVILVDKHPSYQSTILGKELADKWKIPVVDIQHHKAHFASILAEHDRFESQKPILGVIWDGTGLGDDGMIWGGEFFTYRNHDMQRVAHFEYFHSLAGDKMAKEPRLSLFGLIEEPALFAEKFTANELRIYHRLKLNGTLKTSSVGRLFDAVASLLGVLHVSSYEGEAAMLLEDLAWQYDGDVFIDLLDGQRFQNIPTHEIIGGLSELKQQGEDHSKLAASFIHTLAKVIVRKAEALHINTVACSGGVFQNRFLVDQLMKLCKANTIELLWHNALCSNDENIALGQLAYYQHIND